MKFKQLLCKVFFHNLTVLLEYSPAIKKVKCGRCKKVFGINYRVKTFVEWDADLEDMHMIIFPDKYIGAK